MKFLMRYRTLIIIAAIALIAVSTAVVRSRNSAPDWVTEKVSRGEVSQLVSVSGIVEAKDKADLSFPVSGVVKSVYVREGDSVTKGQMLATLEQAELLAERDDAYGALVVAQADKSELVGGPRSEERDVTTAAVAIARDDLARVTAEEEKKVLNAYRTLLSDGLEAYPIDKENDNVPPIVTGTYTCDKEGVYTLSIFGSGAKSGYSYRLSGLESGTYTAYIEAAGQLGSCGLFIQFDADENYSSKDWEIEIPNTKSAVYVTNLNAYELAERQRTNLIDAATQSLEKAEKEQVLENATPRSEELERAEAAIIQMTARLAVIDARIADRSLRAPFAGTVSSVEIVPGESIGSARAMTVVADTFYELTVRIPEIDITKLKVGQHAEVSFDARTGERVPATITFISPVATLIEGVAYFEANLIFDAPPEWLRSGLNADVDIIIDRMTDVLRIPRRFLVEESGRYHVLLPVGNTTEQKPIEVGFVGNDGYAEVKNITEGTTIVAP